jgi:hypothetical protein
VGVGIKVPLEESERLEEDEGDVKTSLPEEEGLGGNEAPKLSLLLGEEKELSLEGIGSEAVRVLLPLIEERLVLGLLVDKGEALIVSLILGE